MNVDYHVHLEEGPYSANWVGRTASALESFMEDKAYTYEWMESLMSRLDKRLAEGEYSEYWLDLYLERAKQLGIKQVGILDHLYRFHDALNYYERHVYLESDKLGDMQRKWLGQVSVIPCMDEFLDFVQSRKEKWEDHGVQLRLGIEADFFPNGFPSFLSTIVTSDRPDEALSL
ncbi:MAG: hypothetical protein ACOX5Q_07260 [Bacillota bacterium]